MHCTTLNIEFFKNLFYLGKPNLKSSKLSKFIKSTDKIINILNKNFINNKNFNIHSLNKTSEQQYIIQFIKFKKYILDRIKRIAEDKYYSLHNHIIFNKPKEIILEKNNPLVKFLFKNIFYIFLKKNKNKNNKIKFK